MNRWIGKVAVVTGASAGIGAAIAESLVNEGLQVVGIARRKDRVEELAKKLEGKPGKLFAVQADLSKEEDIITAFNYIAKNIGPIHILINNAGLGQNTTDLAHGVTETWKKVFDVNVFGLLIATREAIKSMEENKIDGHIIHINSTLGHRIDNYPNMNVYPATKFAVKALAETLRLELDASASKIKVTNLSPGIVETEFIDVAVGWDPERVAVAKQFMKKMNTLYPNDIADAVLYVLGTPPHVQIRELIISHTEGPLRDYKSSN